MSDESRGSCQALLLPLFYAPVRIHGLLCDVCFVSFVDLPSLVFCFRLRRPALLRANCRLFRPSR